MVKYLSFLLPVFFWACTSSFKGQSPQIKTIDSSTVLACDICLIEHYMSETEKRILSKKAYAADFSGLQNSLDSLSKISEALYESYAIQTGLNPYDVSLNNQANIACFNSYQYPKISDKNKLFLLGFYAYLYVANIPPPIDSVLDLSNFPVNEHNEYLVYIMGEQFYLSAAELEIYWYNLFKSNQALHQYKKDQMDSNSLAFFNQIYSTMPTIDQLMFEQFIHEKLFDKANYDQSMAAVSEIVHHDTVLTSQLFNYEALRRKAVKLD